ncbi:MAG: hypothetical protein S4CHLAM102_03790 [Chlamydiia bacterium]|nr:hypothetical protein [Chlamydiia bacterium]
MIVVIASGGLEENLNLRIEIDRFRLHLAGSIVVNILILELFRENFLNALFRASHILVELEAIIDDFLLHLGEILIVLVVEPINYLIFVFGEIEDGVDRVEEGLEVVGIALVGVREEAGIGEFNLAGQDFF